MYSVKNVILFFITNILFGLFFYKFNSFANLFGISVVLLGSLYALGANRSIAVYCLLFTSSFGIILRVLRVGIFYEFDKYAVCGLSVLILLFSSYKISESSKKYVLYFLLLIPGMILAQFNYAYMSLYMSGPLALALTAILFSNIKEKLNVINCLLVVLSPIVMLSSISMLHLMFNFQNLSFGYSAVAEKVTSAGFGPNQISAVLGLGMIICSMLIFYYKNKFNRFIFIVYWFILTIQTAITFSRGGLYGGLIGTLIVLLFNLEKKQILKFLLIAIVIFSSVSIYSSMQSFINAEQKDAIFSRVTRLSTTGRLQMMIDDFYIFLDNPVVGVGVGQSTQYHVKNIFGRVMGSHTFFSRLLAEHGLLGLICIFIMINTVVNGLLYRDTSFSKSITMSLLAFSVFTMMHNDLRLGITAVMFSFCEFMPQRKH